MWTYQEFSDTELSNIPFRDRQGRQNSEAGIIVRAESGFTINAFTLTLKYCPDCNTTRPPRCAHCYICNHCVEKFDHHCPWIGVCVGKKNYFWFILYILAKMIFLWIVTACAIYSLVKSARFELLTKNEGLRVFLVVLFAVLSALGSAFAVFVTLLFGFHIYLIYTNQTTKEYLKKTHEGLPGNPFAVSITRTLKKFCTSRKKKTFLNRRMVLPKIAENTEKEDLIHTDRENFALDTTVAYPSTSPQRMRLYEDPEKIKDSI